MSFADSTDGSGQINFNLMLAVAAYSESSSSFSLAARPVSGNDIAVGSVYSTKAAAETALADFISEAGYPWVPIGTIPDAVSDGVYIVAINMAQVQRMIDDTGTGVSFNGGEAISAGYAPYADGPTAIAALLNLAGSVVNVP